jgi:hypothetical protein
MKTYQLYSRNGAEPDAVVGITEDGGCVSLIFDLNNPDYQQYLVWLAEGNTPLPAE